VRPKSAPAIIRIWAADAELLRMRKVMRKAETRFGPIPRDAPVTTATFFGEPFYLCFL
jgi:hypothetical protein